MVPSRSGDGGRGTGYVEALERRFSLISLIPNYLDSDWLIGYRQTCHIELSILFLHNKFVPHQATTFTLLHTHFMDMTYCRRKRPQLLLSLSPLLHAPRLTLAALAGSGYVSINLDLAIMLLLLYRRCDIAPPSGLACITA